jgi:hypothetical protein
MTSTPAPTAKAKPTAPADATASAGLVSVAGKPAVSATPRALRRYQLISSMVLLVLGLLAVVQLAQLRTELGAAPAAGAQHVRLGEVAAAVSAAGNSAAADAAAGTTSERSSQSLAQAAQVLIAAASTDAGRADQLGSLNAAVLQYGQLLAAGQFDQAEQLRGQSIQPTLDSLGADVSAESDAAWWTSPWLAIGLGALALGALIWVSYRVALRSHRVLNAGLLAAAVGVIAIAGLAAGGTPVSGGAGVAGDAVVQSSSSLTSAQLQSDAATRVLLDAVRAKRWDKAAQSAYNQADQQASDGLAGDLADRYSALQEARKPLVQALAAGDWSKAAGRLAASSDLAAADTALFEAIAAQRADLSAAASADSTSDALLLLFEAGAGALALAGAFLSVRGLQTRIEEYR